MTSFENTHSCIDIVYTFVQKKIVENLKTSFWILVFHEMCLQKFLWYQLSNTLHHSESGNGKWRWYQTVAIQPCLHFETSLTNKPSLNDQIVGSTRLLFSQCFHWMQGEKIINDLCWSPHRKVRFLLMKSYRFFYFWSSGKWSLTISKSPLTVIWLYDRLTSIHPWKMVVYIHGANWVQVHFSCV